MRRRNEKVKVFFDFAYCLSTLSCCKRNQVGAIVIPKDFSEVLAIGYNGPPVGYPNDSCKDIAGACGCVHAEANAVVKCTTRGGILFTTVAPCEGCAQLILNSQKISVVVYNQAYRDPAGRILLSRVMPCYDLGTFMEIDSW